MSTEKTVAKKFVQKCIASGFVVSVNDGECWTVKKSDNLAAILAALESTGEDILRIRDKEAGIVIGTAVLIWGNAPDGSELIADYTANLPMMTLAANF